MNTLFANQQKGLSLIELMISVALGTVIALGVVTIYSDNLQSYRLQENLSRLQENGRFATHFLAKDIRMADHAGCANTSIKDLGIANIVGISGINGARVTDADKYDEPDTITVVFAKNVGIFLTATAAVTAGTPATATATIVNPGGGFFKKGDKIILSDCDKATAFKITGAGAAGAAVNANDITLEALTSNVPGSNYKENAAFLVLSTAEYEIHDPDGTATLRVKRDGGAGFVPLADGIENMQILYGQNIGGGKASYLPAETSGLDMEDVKSVKISLVLTSSEEVTINPLSYTIFGVPEKTVRPTDHKFRQVFTQTIALRNRLP